MKCKALILMIMIIAVQAKAQFLDPLEKATLDFYYDNKTNSIAGSRIVDGSLTTNKFAASILELWLPRDGSIPMPELTVGTLTITNTINVTTNWGWEDLRFPVGVAAPVTPNADVALDPANNAITFDAGVGGASTNFGTGANVDHVWGVAQMPHTWRTNSAVHPHVHFIQRFSDETNCWYMYYRVQPLSGVTNSAWTFIGAGSNEYAFTGTPIHQIAALPSITITGKASTIIDWKIFARGASVSNDLIFKEFDIHYQIEKPAGEQF